MRDPAGRLQFSHDKVIRTLASADLRELGFLRHRAATALVDSGRLIPFAFRGDVVIESPRLPFVSYPFEWCDAQFRAAGLLTLDLAGEALAAGHELKDASAWNVIFDGARPVFCDHLSFQPLRRREWWAFGQFARHFVFPLAVSRLRGLRAHESFALYRDGLPPEKARSLLGARRFLTRLWPLLLERHAQAVPTAAATEAGKSGKPFHQGLIDFSRPLLAAGRGAGRSPVRWDDYTNTRSHYSAESSRLKQDCVQRWLAHLAPAWVVDLGCNTGEFTHMAARTGANVIAVDYDHDSIERLHTGLEKAQRVHCVVGHLGDLSGGRGWRGTEFPGLAQRLESRADVLLMLALIHHLVLSEGIPLDEVVQLAAHVSRGHVIAELLDDTDPMVAELAAQRDKGTDDFSLQRQLQAFATRFDVLEQVSVPQTARTLVLLKKKAT